MITYIIIAFLIGIIVGGYFSRLGKFEQLQKALMQIGWTMDSLDRDVERVEKEIIERRNYISIPADNYPQARALLNDVVKKTRGARPIDEATARLETVASTLESRLSKLPPVCPAGDIEGAGNTVLSPPAPSHLSSNGATVREEKHLGTKTLVEVLREESDKAREFDNLVDEFHTHPCAECKEEFYCDGRGNGCHKICNDCYSALHPKAPPRPAASKDFGDYTPPRHTHRCDVCNCEWICDKPDSKYSMLRCSTCQTKRDLNDTMRS